MGMLQASRAVKNVATFQSAKMDHRVQELVLPQRVQVQHRGKQASGYKSCEDEVTQMGVALSSVAEKRSQHRETGLPSAS